MAELRSIMMVEDDPDIGFVACMTLEEIGGWKVSLFSDGPSALAAAQELRPDLILLDFRLPEMNGGQVLTELRAKGVTAPVIFMTASVMPAQVEALMQLGAVAVLPKPFDPMALPSKLRQIWDGVPG